MKRAFDFDVADCLGGELLVVDCSVPVATVTEEPMTTVAATATETTAITTSATPPRCPTPDPMDVLPPEQALLAALLASGSLGDGGQTFAAPVPAFAPPTLQPNPPGPSGPSGPSGLPGPPADPGEALDPNALRHAGLFREEGGIKQWMKTHRRPSSAVVVSS